MINSNPSTTARLRALDNIFYLYTLNRNRIVLQLSIKGIIGDIADGPMPNKGSSNVKGISFVIIAFLLGYQLRATYDFGTDITFIKNADDTHNNILITLQDILRVQLQNSTTDSQQQKSQILVPTGVSRPKFSKNNPTKCERQWDWPFLDAWVQTEGIKKEQDVTMFRAARSNDHETARGTINMQVLRQARNNEAQTPSRVIIYVTHQDAMGANAWHRIAVQYMVWIAWQVAEHRLSELWSTITQVELMIPCIHLQDVPQGWNDLLFVINNNSQSNIDNIGDSASLVNTTMRCTNGTFIKPTDVIERFGTRTIDNTGGADVVLIPPADGLLWDLAWDTTFSCNESHMFKTFISQFARRATSRTTVSSSSTAVIAQSTETQNTSTIPVVCWILRYGNPQRDISNRDEVHGMLLSIFDTVRLIHVTRYHTSDQIKNAMDDCQVFYGVHGAGMVNAMWATLSSAEKAAVVEVLPNNQPQYFRCVSGLVGHYYEGVTTDNLMDERDYHIELEQSAEALRRALRYLTEE